MTTILVTGSREWPASDQLVIRTHLFRLWSRHQISQPDDWFMVRHGNARGVDRFARNWAREGARLGVRVGEQPYRIQSWEWGEYGGAAGQLRNRRMVDDGGIIMCLAFSYYHSSGTEGCANYARLQGVPVTMIRWEELDRDEKF